MSTLDALPHVLAVYPEVDTTDERGNPVRAPANSPVMVPAAVHFRTAQESFDLGQDTRTMAKVFARTFPAGAFSRIEWEGRTWDVVGEPKRFGRTEHVAHIEIEIVARDPQNLPIGA